MGRPWMDMNGLAMRGKTTDPWVRQAPSPGVRHDCRVGIMRPCTAKGDEALAGRRWAGGRRNCSPRVTDVRTMLAVCLSARGARPVVRAELGGCGNGQGQTMTPGHRTRGDQIRHSKIKLPGYIAQLVVMIDTWAGRQLAGE